MGESMILVEVVYATTARQKLLTVKVPTGSTVESAIRQSGILAEFPEIDLATNKVGVFSKACKLDTVLREKDRVEIYRALIADPKEVRRQRAAEGKAMKKGAD
jgi:putative ubiquitin-RnfH superfamily antitoxin RatB of RatAB toxin-antitoxin module